MAEERDTYEATRARLEEIATAVRKKDVSLEKSIELLEEGVRLANLCTEQVDQAQLADSAAEAVAEAVAVEGADSRAGAEPPAVAEGTAPDVESDPERVEAAPSTDAVEGVASDEDDDVLAEAFADVGDDIEREACEGQTEAFGD